MAPKEKYRVTDKAGPYVAGKKAKAGDTLLLTEEQARYGLISGELEPDGKAAREAASKPSKTALKDDKKGAAAG